MTALRTASEPRRMMMNANHEVPSAVDQYWAAHVVCSTIFQTAQESEEYLEWRFHTYPLFREFSGLYGFHDGEVVLDYGCGPGNDLVGFALYSNAKKIIGMDVSSKALDLAAARGALHGVDPGKIELIQTTDETSTIPLDDNSVDFINCQGVLQHTSHPETVLQEFHRVMKPQARGVVMVYNRDSLWLHLYTAYQCLVLQDAFPGLNAYEAFSRNVDGVACPIARAYAERDFRSLCEEIGFIVEYAGGYLAETEMASLKRYRESALQDPRLQDEHKEFLRNLTFDRTGYPLYRGKHAGIGGVYRLYCWNKETGPQRDLARSCALQAELADLREQIVQTGAHYAQFRSRFAAMERDYCALQGRKRRWLSISGIRAARSLCCGLLRLGRFVGL